jgi:hypothetical protein
MKKNHGGIIFDTIVPGDFYISNDPGGWTDRITGIKIPGPIVNIDQDTRMIEGIATMPDPVQIPHVKIVVNVKDKDRKVQERTEVPFDRADDMPLNDGLNQALATGIIERLEDEVVAELYPNAWAKRKAHYVYDDEKKTPRPMRDLISEFHASRKTQDKAILESAEVALITVKAPPPPPVKK